MRIHLFEFEDFPWFPGVIREGMVDYLRFILGNINFYKPIVPLIKEGLDKSGQNRIIDLCSGGGGAIEQVMKVPKNLNGLQTMFSAFHHFRTTDAKKILRNAMDNNRPIAIFDGGDKNILVFVGIIFIHLIIFFLFTPFFKPFRLSRIIFTYALPLIPLCTIWDGMVSIIRLHEPKNLQKIVQGVDPNKRYFWKIGKAKHRFGLKVSYLIGYSNDYKTDV